MKTPDEIKKGLEVCSKDKCVCDECEFGGNVWKWRKIMGYALAYIIQLESRLARVEKERDAAIVDMRSMAVEDICNLCARLDEGYIPMPPHCKYANDGDCFRWRGVCEENTKEEKRVIEQAPRSEAMTINGYQIEALRTASGMDDEYPMWLNGALGLNGEAGEVADMVKKHLFQGHPINFEHMAKELGDVAWYVAVTAHAIGYDLETILLMNVDKLRKRYPNGFEAERSLNREKGDI